MTHQTQARHSFCGLPVSDEDLKLITEIVTEFGLPRSEMADTVCELLNWVRPNGKLKTVECLKFLVRLESDGLFVLPAPKNQRAAKPRKAKRTEAGADIARLSCKLREIGPVSLCCVRTQKERDHWKELVDRYHYLGYRVPFGASMRYFIRSGGDEDRILGCLQFSSPAWKVGVRDEWIGWNAEARDKHRQRIVQNSRFLILPGIQIKGQASHVLGKAAKQIGDDWEAAYCVRPVLLETFVDETRFRGTCYRAANWRNLGLTKGRGRMDRENRFDQPIKSVWVYPLRRNWRNLLVAEGTR